jgi:hypothetical protein
VVVVICAVCVSVAAIATAKSSRFNMEAGLQIGFFDAKNGYSFNQSAA